jgi:CBS domain-containing protein
VPQKVCLDSENFVKHVMNVTIAIAAGENGNPDPWHLGRGNFDATRINIFVTGPGIGARIPALPFNGSIVFIFHATGMTCMAASVVRDIMTKEIVMIDGTDTALEGAKLMAEKGISSLFVVRDAVPVGIVTERDFVKKVCAKDIPISSIKVFDIMSKILTTADPETPIEVAVQRMVNHKIRRLPIMEGGKIVGIITVTDLAKHLRTTLLLEGALSDSNSFDDMIATMDHEKH